VKKGPGSPWVTPGFPCGSGEGTPPSNYPTYLPAFHPNLPTDHTWIPWVVKKGPASDAAIYAQMKEVQFEDGVLYAEELQYHHSDGEMYGARRCCAQAWAGSHSLNRRRMQAINTTRFFDPYFFARLDLPPWVLKRSLVLGSAVTLGPVKWRGWHVIPVRPMVDMRFVAGRMVSDKCSNSNPIPSNKTALLIFPYMIL